MSVIARPGTRSLLYGVIYAIGNGAASMAPVGVMVTRAFPERTGIANALAMSGMSVGQLVMIAALAAVLAARELALGLSAARRSRISCCCRC